MLRSCRPRRLFTVLAALLAAVLALALACASGATARPTGPHRTRVLHGAVHRTTAALPPHCGPTVRKRDGRRWTCTFDDEFTGTRLDSKKWVPIVTAGNGVTGGHACFVDSPTVISVGRGHLNLTVRKTKKPFFCATPSGGFTTSYSAGQVATYGLFSQTYGRFSIRAKFPAATVAGLQSTLWLWPENNILSGLTGEIDIAENYSEWYPYAIPTLHYSLDPTTVDPSTNTNVYTSYNCLIGNPNAFHDYTLVWNATTMTISVDHRTCLVDHLQPLGPSPFDQPYFIALTQELGVTDNSETAATPLPATEQIDWVRAWR